LFVENGHKKNGVLAAKTTNSDSDSPKDESENNEVQKIGDNKELNSINFVVDNETGVIKKNGSYTHIVDTEVVATGLNLSPNANNMRAHILLIKEFSAILTFFVN
jgi:hypothetical protein